MLDQNMDILKAYQLSQIVEIEHLASIQNQDPATPEYDAIIIGAGVCGIYQAYRLQQMGKRFLCLNKPQMSAAPGTGTDTRGAVSTLKARPMGTPSQPNFWRNGTGANTSRRAKRQSATCSMSQTSST